MKTWITLKDGRVNDIVTTPDDNPPSFGKDWNEVPNDWKGNHGDKLGWFNSDMRRIPDRELVKQGKREDNRGRVFNTTDQSQRIIHHLDEPLGEDETKEAPLDNEPFQVFDTEKKKWVIDEKKREIAEKESALGAVLAQIRDYEERGKRPNQEITLGIEVEENTKWLRKFRTDIESLRPEVNRLEAELAELKESA